MIHTLAFIACVIFSILGFWHLYWAFGGSLGKAAAIPEVNGAPAFVPTAIATALVGAALMLFAALIAGAAGLVETPIPRPVLGGFSYGLAIVLFVRAVGEFRLVGFFKRVRGSAFARWDTWVYSPLCLFLSMVSFSVAIHNVA